jgi:DHA2 family multidrug resistance protein
MTVLPAQLLLPPPASPTVTSFPALDRTIKLLIVIVVTLVTCSEFLTSYAVGVALADIQGDLAASFDEASWVLTTYSTCFLVGLIFSNWLADRVGYRRYMIGAVLFFMCASIGCGLSHTLATMLVFRGAMGFAGGNFLVRAQTAINRTHTGKDRMRALMLLVLGVVVIGRTAGAAVGGYFAEWYSWRYIFFLNIPLSLIAIVVLIAFLPDLKALPRPGGMDVIGMVLLVGWVASTQIVLSRGERDDWFADPFIATLAGTALVSLALFIWWERWRRPDNPVISLAVYRSRNFVIGSIYVVILGMMLYGQMYIVPQFLRGVQHHSAWGTGKLQTVNAIAFTMGLLGGAFVMKRVGIRLALAVGAAAFAIGMWSWAARLTPDIPDQAMFLPLALTGFGAGWQVGPASTLINNDTPDILMGEGMGLYLCQRQLGGSWGVAILTILVDRQRSFWSGRLGESLHDYSLATQDALHQTSNVLRWSGFADSQADAGGVGLLHGRLVVQSTVNAFVDTFRYQAALGAIALILVLLFKRGHPLTAARRWVVQMVR